MAWWVLPLPLILPLTLVLTPTLDLNPDPLPPNPSLNPRHVSCRQVGAAVVSGVATDPNPNSDPGPNQVGAAVASEVAKIDAVLAGLQAEREAGSGARDTAELREELQGLTHRMGGKAGREELLLTLALDLAQTLTLTLT